MSWVPSMGSPDDPAITDPTDVSSGKPTFIGLLKGLLLQHQGKGPSTSAAPVVPRLLLPTARQGLARVQLWWTDNHNLLGPGGVWPGVNAQGYWVSPYRYVVGFAASDQGGSFVIQEGETALGVWYQTQAATNVAGSVTNPQVATPFAFEVHGHYMRPMYTNGGVAQANFSFFAWGVPS